MISKIVQTFDFIKLKKKIRPTIKKMSMAVISEDPGAILKGRINKGVNYNNEALAPLKKSTLNIRKMRGRPSNKPLVDTGNLLKSIKTVKTKGKIGVRFLKYGMHQAEGFTTRNYFAVKRGSKIVGWRDYSKGIRVMPRPWIHPEEPWAGLVKRDRKTILKVIKALKREMRGQVVHKIK